MTARVGAAVPRNGRTSEIEALLEEARRISLEEFAPEANRVDEGEGPPAANIQRLAEAGLLGLTTPVEYGGQGASPWAVREYFEIMASGCGVTTFVNLQHMLGCQLIATGQYEAVKRSHLPRLATGDLLCTVAFSHVRRPGPPAVRVEQDGDDWVFNGLAPWCTGATIADEVVLAGALPDGRLAWALAPLKTENSPVPSPPMSLCTMNASDTVTLDCKDVRLGPERRVKVITLEEMAASDVNGILTLGALPLGVGAAAIRVLKKVAEDRQSDQIARIAGLFEAEQAKLKRAIDRCAGRMEKPGFKERALDLRGWAIDFSMRAAHAAVTATGGRANERSNDGQRLVREAMLYTLTAQTKDVQAATLEALALQHRHR